MEITPILESKAPSSPSRLNFRIPEFSRLVWSSGYARDLWAPRIKAINTAWVEIERASVFERKRPGGLQTVPPEELIAFQSACFSRGIDYAVIGREGVGKSYSSAATPPGKQWNYRVYFGDRYRDFLQYWAEGSQFQIAELLAYPICCAEFFRKWWVDEGWRDLTPMMAATWDQHWDYRTNILLRHIGVRPVFHLPCSFHCEPTKHIADKIFNLAEEIGFHDEVLWIRELLSLPVKWSSLHGVAILTTPLFKIVHSTDPLPEEVKIEFHSPFPQSTISTIGGIDDTWTDNGFTSLFGMKRAHDDVLMVIGRILLDQGRVIDLGCGNGLLLEKIQKKFPFLIPYGVEHDERKYLAAKRRLVDNVYYSNIFHPENYLHDNFELALVSINRLSEVPEDMARRFLCELRDHCKYVIAYSYGDWNIEHEVMLLDYFDFVDTHPKIFILKAK